MKEINRFGFWVIFCILGLLNIPSCTQVKTENNRMIERQLKSDFPKLVQDFESRILSNVKTPINIKVLPQKAPANIQQVLFVNDKTGYAVDSVNTIYLTVDRGSKWIRNSTLASYVINDLFFVSEIEGYIAAYKKRTDGESDGYVLKTTDGGRSWKLCLTLESSVPEKIQSNSDGSVWVLGRHNVTGPERDSINLISFSDDKGKTWIDVSGSLNLVAKDGGKYISDYLVDFFSPSDDQITVLSLRGKLFTTRDKGKMWNLFSALPNEPQQTAIRHLGRFKNGKYWIGGGTVSIEGKWGMTALADVNGDWERFRLQGYYFSDIHALNKDVLVACGSLVAPANFGGETKNDTGLILYSSDNGKNWSKLFSSRETHRFLNISQLSSSTLIVVGDNGEMILLTVVS